MFIFSLKLVKLTMNRHTVHLCLKNPLKEKKQLRNGNDLTKGGTSMPALAYLSLRLITGFP